MEVDDRPWFRSTFSGAQRRHIQEVFQPMGLSNDAESMLVGSPLEVAYNLGSLLGWFDNPRDRGEYAVPMLEHLANKARAMDPETCAEADVETLHFTYQAIMEHAYKLRGEPAWLDVTIWAATRQVELAPRTATALRASYGRSELPMHTGYERLAILADKAGKDAEVIRLCERALEQGWTGSWERRIEKARRRLAAKRGE